MSYSVTFDPNDNLIVITHRGLVDKKAADNSRNEAARLAKEHNCYRVLADLRDVVSGISATEIYHQAQMTTDQLSKLNLKAYDFKRALVIDKASPDPIFFENVSRNRGHNVRVFDELDEARKWLRKE